MKEILVGGAFGLLIGICCLPALLRDAKVYCEDGYKICVNRYEGAGRR